MWNKSGIKSWNCLSNVKNHYTFKSLQVHSKIIYKKKNYVEDECWIFSDFSFRFSRLKLSLFGLWYGSVVELKIIGDYVGWGVTCWIVFEWGELWTYWVIVAKIFINLVIFCKNSKTLASTFVTFQVFKQSILKMMNSPW